METLTASPKPFFARLWIYSKEMFPVLVYIPFVVALYFCMNAATQIISGHEIVVDTYGIVGMISAFFMMLMMRTFDDLKDFDIDKDLFPWRATPRGDVLKSDLHILAITSFSALILVNILFAPKTLLVFGIVMIYLILTFLWFFNEEIHRKNLYLTMADHQPIPYSINLFLIHTALASGTTYDNFSLNHLLLLFIFTLPVTAWETSRKIRAIGKETHYETFSLLFGTRTATWIPFVCLLLTGGLALYVGNSLDLDLSFVAITIALILFACFYYIRFLLKPIHEYNILTPIAMVFSVLLFINLMVHLLMNAQISWQI
ncbi:MAG: hypothetical protein AAFQ68_09115 [Bacteroidota bacterium]